MPRDGPSPVSPGATLPASGAIVETTQSNRRDRLDAIGWMQLDSAPPTLSLKNHDLMADCEELDFQVGPTANDVPDSAE